MESRLRCIKRAAFSAYSEWILKRDLPKTRARVTRSARRNKRRAGRSFVHPLRPSLVVFSSQRSTLYGVEIEQPPAGDSAR